MRPFLLLLSVFLIGPIAGFSQSVTITPESKTVGIGDTISVNISATGFTGLLTSAQGTLTWDPDVLYFDNSLPDALSNFGLSGMNASADFGFTDILFGKLYLLWTYPGFGGSVVGANYFTMKFIVVGNNGSSTNIGIVDDNTPIEFSEFLSFPPFISQIGTTMNQGLITVGAGFPVTWLGLDAKTTDEGVSVSWATATELNNDYFEVERVLPNGETTIIGRMDAAGTADSERNYSFLDQTAPQGQLKYRIKQVDFDGGYSYSSFVEVVNVQEESLVYPNPTNGTIFIAMPEGQQDKVEITVRDLTGRIVLATTSEGEAVLQISIEDQPTGWYLAETISSSGVRTETRVLKMN